MKKKLMELLAKVEAKKAALVAKSEKSEDVVELRSINTEIDAINADIAELRVMIDGAKDEFETRGKETSKLNVISTYVLKETEKKDKVVGKYESDEYRNAFMTYVISGDTTGLNEFRLDDTALTTDITAVIPNTILNRVIEQLKSYGQIYARVTKTSYKGGLQIPISSLKPTASWIAEGSVADKQSMTLTGKVVFAYNKLQVRVAVSIEADTVSLPIFEQTITSNITEAIMIALEQAIISGSGTGQPLGIVNDTRIQAGQKISMSVADAGKFETWVNVEGMIPLAYEGKAVLIMTKKDWNKYIVGMVDAEGEPIERINYTADGLPVRRLLGMEVVLVDTYLPTLAAAQSGDTFGIIIDLSEYYLNSNMQMTFKRYFWEETDEWISKATLIADGKLGDINGVLLLQKT